MKLNETMETAIAFVEVASEQIVTSLAKAKNSACKTIDFEIAIKKLNSLKKTEIYNLGEYTFANQVINQDLINQIKEIDKKIETIKKTIQHYNHKHPSTKNISLDLVFVKGSTIIQHCSNITNN